MPWIADGKCVIDVVLKLGRKFDFATSSELKDAARKVVDTCIFSAVDTTQGGAIGDVGA